MRFVPSDLNRERGQYEKEIVVAGKTFTAHAFVLGEDWWNISLYEGPNRGDDHDRHDYYAFVSDFGDGDAFLRELVDGVEAHYTARVDFHGDIQASVVRSDDGELLGSIYRLSGGGFGTHVDAAYHYTPEDAALAVLKTIDPEAAWVVEISY